MTKNFSLTVNASAAGWLDTGIDVAAGDMVDVRAGGWIRFARWSPGGFPRDPDGRDEGGHREIAGDAWPAPGYTRNSLVFKIGQNIFQGGSNGHFQAVAAGRLFCTNNDDNVLDNEGRWDVEIAVTSGANGLARAFIILRPEGAYGMGHVGFGFETSANSNQFVFGSLEGTGAPYIPPGENNHFWVEETGSNYQHLLIGKNYHTLKVTSVTNPNPVAAKSIFAALKNGGYNVLDRNCLHISYWVLKYYGVTHLPTPFSLQTMPPTNWSNNFVGREYKF